MKLSGIDARVLDLIADDYYGLWEVREYLAGLMPDADGETLEQECRTRITDYLAAGLAQLFVGDPVANEFQLIPPAEHLFVLANEISWQKPTDRRPVVAVFSTKEGEAAAKESWDSD